MTIEHAGLDAQQSAAHAAGLEHFVERLQRLATSGDAGRDEWAAAPDPIDPVVASEAASAALQPALRGLTSEDRQKPTPCPDFNGHQLAEHLMSSIAEVGAMAGATVTRPEQGSLEHQVSVMADQAITGWRGRGLAGTIPLPNGHELPATTAASILMIELLLHGWDLAQTSGQQMVVGQVDPRAQSAPTEESMQRWTSWGNKVGAQLTDFGAPPGPAPGWAVPATRCRSPATRSSRPAAWTKRACCATGTRSSRSTAGWPGERGPLLLC